MSAAGKIPEPLLWAQKGGVAWLLCPRDVEAHAVAV